MSRLAGRRGFGWSANWRRRRPRLALRASRGGRILAALAVLVVGLAVWTAWDLRSARRELVSARAELSAAANDLGTATDASTAANLRRATRHAVTRTRTADRRVRRSPVLRLAGFVPGISTQRDGLFRAVRVARDAARIGDDLAAVAQRHADGLTVRSGAVDLVAVQVLADAVERAGRELAAIPPAHRGAQWAPLGHATQDLDGLLADTSSRLTHGAGVMNVVADLLGATGPKRIFVALLNNAEMRDQGMALSYVVAETADGGFHLTRSGSMVDIPLPAAVTDVALPQGTRTIFGSLTPERIWQSVNATADTALSGALMRSMYRAATGDEVDGVIAIDVPALSALLAVTGPVNVVGIPQAVTADNAASVLLNDLYTVQAGATFSEARNDRLEQLAATIDAVIERIRSSPVNGTSLVRALGTAALGGHTWVFTADPGGQRALVRAGLSGAPGRVHPERTIHLAVQNGTATKLDWFVDPSVDVDVAVAEDGTATIKTTVSVPNGAPVPTPSSEQFGPDGIVTRVAGLYRGRVYFWGPSTGDQLDSVSESGLRLNFKTVEVAAGGRATASFSTVVPRAVQDGVLRLRFVPQPRVRPMKLHITVTGVGWKIESPTELGPQRRPLMVVTPSMTYREVVGLICPRRYHDPMRSLRLVRRVAVLAMVAALLASPAALAQTTTAPPYPGTPTTVPPQPTSAEVDLGLQEVGAVLNISLCNFAPGTAVRLTVRIAGRPDTVITPDAVANSSGCIVVRVEVLPTLVGLGRSPLQPFAATGLAATGTNVQIKVNGQVVTVGPYGTVVTLIATGTGNNGAARTATVKFTVVKRGTIQRLLSRTGTTIVKWTPFGLGLVGVGYLFVLATRRRREVEA